MNKELEEFKILQNNTDCEIIAHQINIISIICAGNPNKTIDLITGYLWDEEEAENIKSYLK